MGFNSGFKGLIYELFVHSEEKERLNVTSVGLACI